MYIYFICSFVHQGTDMLCSCESQEAKAALGLGSKWAQCCKALWAARQKCLEGSSKTLSIQLWLPATISCSKCCRQWGSSSRQQ